MISALPEIAPISDMRIRQAEIIEKAQHGPIVLIERGSKPVLVAITPELWNRIVGRIEHLEDAIAVYRKKWEIATGQDEMIELSPDTIQEWLGDASTYEGLDR